MKTRYTLIVALLLIVQASWAQGERLFRWFNVELQATEGGRIYGTGDFQLPKEDEDFRSQQQVQWVLCQPTPQGSLYTWIMPDAGYHFVGWENAEGQPIPSLPNPFAQPLPGDTSALPLATRLPVQTDIAATEDGIVSGNNLHSTTPLRLIARFEKDVNTRVTGLSIEEQDARTKSQPAYDLSGRKLRKHGKATLAIEGGRVRVVR